jgi:hypothetical protein
MKKSIIIFGLIIAGLAALIPFISTNPDGLQTLVSRSDATESTWSGLIGDYAIAAISNPYLSTLVAGSFGTIMVFFATFVLGAKFLPKKKNEPAQTI